MEDQIAVSVVIPAFNSEKVIGKCIESVLNQTLSDIEIIAVDDGSRDSTRQILKKYAMQDSRIRVIEKDRNEGLSAARNSALEIVKGEYVGFVDSDDWIEENYFETIYTGKKDADLIISGYSHDAMDEQRNMVNISRRVVMESGFWDNKEDIIEQAAYIDSGKMFAYTWNKLYRASLIKKSNLKFSQQVLIEDFLFNIEYWNKIKSLSVVECSGYHYVKASKDALTQKFLPNFLDIMDIRFDAIKNLAEKNGVYCGTVKSEIANVYIKHAIAGIVRNCSAKGNYSFIEQYQRCRDLMKNSRSIEARSNARGRTKQEVVCNFVYKLNLPIFILMFAKMLHLMQTKSNTAFDKMK